MNKAKKFLNRLFIIIFTFSQLSLTAHSSKELVSSINLPKSQNSARSKYLKFLNSFKQQHCGQEVEKVFDQLVESRKKLTLYVPELSNGEVDLETIRNGLPQFEKKWQWLITLRKNLRELKTWPNGKILFQPLQKTLAKLLNLKERRFMKGDTSPTLEQESKILLKQLQSQYEKIIQKVFYLQGFGYPVDHLNQRYLFDDYNSKEEKKYVQQANKMMFLRKLYEDGTFNSKNENSDLYLRTTLNTISIKLKSDGPWLNEDIRHDLEWAILRIDQLVRYGKTEQIQRVQNWINRIAKARQFYKNILDMKGTHKELQQFINKREAGKKLKDFVYKKNAEIYKSLLTQKEYIRAYFVFDQILLHEVGQASVANFRDRQDVAQVIINSRFNPKLSIIGENETLYSYLIEAGVDKDKMSNPSWLNAMFKGLRFSFTLYYIPSVKYLFCPDFYKTAKVTRSKNLHLIRNTLEAPRDNFKATRYFSRWSMLGRIDMSRVWSEYFQIPERTGAKYKSDAKLKRNFEAKNYRYLYSFEDPTKQIFHVLEMGSKTYTLKLINGKPSFFAYRDTHQFRYFQLLK